ncbi:restriction endonuclease subunit S [Streptomyces sp. RKAG290]|uniref:restriction endonuclease subunit S n=1 Tax=Streptomyces sp. RKAG290 TaxID=2888348 RepID=UPI002033FCCA|nr:restriction endonuclease subunit S [Streptomyces sp. RKAG290]MCM2413214.1 restriction endonuclease subunit S [Streptomyces sp. RKAG290]
MAKTETATGGRDATTGVIPGRWALSVGDPQTATAPGFRWTRLSDVARLESGHTPSRRKPEYWGGGIPWIGIKDATGNHGRTITSTLQSVTESGIANSSARILPAGTVCLSRTASVGYVVTMGVEMATSQDFVNWVCGPNISSRYLHYILMSERESVRRFAHGTTHQTVYYPEVKAFHVCIPERAEQDAIARVLGALDDKIAINARIGDSVDFLVGSYYQRLVSSQVLRKMSLGDIADVNKRTVKPSDGNLRYVDISSVGVGSYEWPELISWNEAPGRARRKAAVGDTIWSTVRPNRRSHALVLDNDPSLVFSTGLAVLSPKSVGAALLYEITRTGDFLGYLESVAEGSAYPAVRAERFKNAPVLLPAAEECEAFEKVALELRQRAHQAAVESRTLATLRDTLLPQLMSGKLRVRDAERIVEDAV